MSKEERPKRRKREWTEIDTGELSVSQYLDGMKDEVSKHCIKAGKQTYRCKKNRSLGCKFGMRSYTDKKSGREVLEKAGEHVHERKKTSERFIPGEKLSVIFSMVIRLIFIMDLLS